jgi:putative ABC transport system ATP-binding protein
VSKEYVRGSERVRALKPATFSIRRGEIAAIVGPSGAGKTTLLNLIGAIDAATSGSIRVAGTELAGLSEARRTDLRRARIGFIFQDFGLVPGLTALENVTLPLAFARRLGWSDDAPRLLKRVGLHDRMSHQPRELSGGEMQRVAIARALITRPELLLADEPTGNLDAAAGEQVFSLLWELSDHEGLTVVVSTHNPALAAGASRRLRLEDGCLVEGGS